MTASLYLLCLLIFIGQEVVPYKAADEYEVIVDYKFQERPSVDKKAVYDVSEEGNRRTNSGPLPYLNLQIKLLKLNSGELKVKIVNSNGHVMTNRKIAVGTIIKLDVGFIDDVKDRVAPHEFTALFYTDSKKPISRIHFLIMEDGTFMVNEEKKSKF